MEVSATDADEGEESSFVRLSTSSIMDAATPPMRWIVPDYVGEGLTILGGRQKAGKSWLAMNWAIAVAVGGVAMGTVACEQGDVLYVDTENGARRVRLRIDALYPDQAQRPDLSRLEWMNEAPSLGERLIEALDDWRSSVIRPRLVVIDAAQKPDWKAAASDTAALPKLQRWATTHGMAVVWLHRMRKAADPLVALGGSGGVFGFADATLLLDRDAAGSSLQMRGRDGDDRHSALRFAAGVWALTGEAPGVRRSDDRMKIIEVIDAAGKAMGPSDVADALGRPVAAVKMMMIRMEKAGELTKHGHGHYHSPRTAEAAAELAERSREFTEWCRKHAPPGRPACDAVPELRDELIRKIRAGEI
jgi:hypothetical protein